MIAALLLVPALAGVLAFLLRANRARRALLVGAAAVHAALVFACWFRPVPPLPHAWLELDALGLLFLSIASLLFLAAAIYAAGYLAREDHGARPDFEESGQLFSNAPEAVFTGCLLLFLATLTLVSTSQHFGLLWVAMEATTLVTAPLIYFHRHHRSLEAAWKYLLICSVGIALALLGNFFFAVAASAGPGEPVPLVLGELLARAPDLDVTWLRAGFLFLLVGYGTKMGLAPLHTWLPDAHSECPSVVSALLSGALLNGAFLGVLRGLSVCSAAGEGPFGQGLLVVFGLASVGMAAVFIIRQPDYKRMLAYSSVEHVGILALGVGIGGGAVAGALLHAVNHSLAKAMLFLVAGNILAAYHTKESRAVGGLLRRLPVTGTLWVLGFLAISGVPPFGPFVSKFTILTAAFAQGRWGVATAFLVLLALVFAGMGQAMLGMAHGGEAPRAATRRGEPWLAVAPPVVLAALLLVLGVYVPPILSGVLAGAARSLGLS